MKIQFQTHLDFARKNPGWPLFVLDGLWGVSDALIIISLPLASFIAFESSTLILYKELSCPIFQSLSVSKSIRDP